MLKNFYRKLCKENGCPFIMLLFLLLIVAMISLKANYQMDETCSYTFANNVGSGTVLFEDGVRYEPSSAVFMKAFAVDNEERFNYANVWLNQARDVHPPFYHALLHTICSFFPGTVSFWYAGVINIIFSLATLLVVYKLFELLLENHLLCNLFSLAYVLVSGILIPTAFLRMYVMAMFWVTLLSYLFVKETGKAHSGWRFYVSISMVTIAGALTHYYCIVFAVGISCVYGCYLLGYKRWKDVFVFCGTMLLVSGGGAYLIFPSMIERLFFGGRGSEALHNFSNLFDYSERLKIFFAYVNDQLFGGMIGYIFLGFILGGLLLVIKNIKISKKKICKNVFMKYLVLVIPTILCFLIISKIAAYAIERYIYPIYAVTFVWVLCVLFEVFDRVFVEKILSKKCSGLIICLVLFMVVIGSWKSRGWVYLERQSYSLFEKASSYSGLDCLCIYNRAYEVQPSFLEASRYKSITFIQKDKMETLSDLDILSQNEIILLVVEEFNDNKEDYVKKIIEKNSTLSKYEVVGTYGYGTSYYLY